MYDFFYMLLLLYRDEMTLPIFYIFWCSLASNNLLFEIFSLPKIKTPIHFLNLIYHHHHYWDYLLAPPKIIRHHSPIQHAISAILTHFFGCLFSVALGLKSKKRNMKQKLFLRFLSSFWHHLLFFILTRKKKIIFYSTNNNIMVEWCWTDGSCESQIGSFYYLRQMEQCGVI